MRMPTTPSRALQTLLLSSTLGALLIWAAPASAGGCPTTWTGQSQGLRAKVDCSGQIALATERGGRLSLRTVAFGRGASAPSGAPLGLVGETGSVLVHRDAAVERVRAVAGGFEQSWELVAPPPGSGELIVQIALDGAQPSAPDERGMLLRVAGGSERVRYGLATWIDAAGRRSPVAARWNGGIELVVPEALLESSSYPAVLDPVVDLETETDAPVMAPVGTAGGYRVSTAFDGTNYVAVWLDDRHCYPTMSCDYRLFAARVSPQGSLLDPTGITLLAEHVDAAAVAFGGDTYLVVYAAHTDTSSDTNIFARRVGLDGSLPDSSPRLLASNPNDDEGNPAVGFDGTNFLAVWDTDSAFGGTITGARVSPAGLLVGTAQAISDGTPSHLEPQVAYCGSSLLVAYGNEDTDEIVGRTVGSDGLPSSATIGTGIDAWSYSLTAGADHFLVAGTTNASSPVFARTLDATGTPLGTGTAVTASGESPHAAFDGTSFVVLFTPYNSEQSVRASRVETDGTIGTPSNVLVITNETDHYVRGIQGGASPMLVTVTSPMGTAGRWLPVGLTSATAEFAIAQSANAQRFPGVAATADQFLMAWEDMRTGDPAIFAMRYDTSGVPMDAEAFAVNDDNGEQARPLVASNGTDYFVAWNDADGLRGTLVGADASIGSAHGVVVKSGDASGARLAGSAMGFVAAFVDEGSTADPDVLMTVQIDASGAPSAPQTVAQTTGNFNAPAVAASATGYLVAWWDPDTDGLRAWTYDANGTELGTVALGSYQFGYGVNAASDGSGYLVVAAMTGRWVGWILDGNGQLLGSRFDIARDLDGADDVGWDMYDVGASFDGRSYVVTWTTKRFTGDAVGEVMAAWVAKNGTVLSEPSGFEVLPESHRAWRALVAGGTEGRALVGVNRYLDDVEHRAFRASTVLVTNDYELPPEGGAGGAGATGGGGAVGGAGGDGAAAGSPAEPSDEADDEGGCGCRLGATHARGAGVWLVALAAGPCLVRRRQRQRHAVR